MIVKSLKAQFKLDIELQGCQYRILQNNKVIVTYNDANQIGVYRISDQNKTSYFQITKGITQIEKCNNWEFLLSKKENIILCRAEESSNQIIIFSINISKQQIINYQRIKLNGQLIQAAGQFYSQFYQLIKGKLKIISYKKFPKITKSVFRRNITFSQIISYENLKLIQLVDVNAQEHYFRLPLDKKLSQEVNYSVRYINQFFMIKTRDPIKSIQYGSTEQLFMKICRVDNQRIKFIECQDQNSNKIFEDKDNNLKIFRMLPIQKIIRKLPQANIQKQFKLNYRRLVIIFKRTNNNLHTYYLCDIATNQLFHLSNSVKITIRGNALLTLSNTQELQVYEFKYPGLARVEININ